jgi:serine/threonine protein kinase
MSKVYTLAGDTLPLDHPEKVIFRKMTNNRSELEICRLLMKNPHKNIINFYEIGNDYIDMELVETHFSYSKNIRKEIFYPVKDYLQSLGIIYIDWKKDNLGIGSDGNLKLFDFDCSGLISGPEYWIYEPPQYFAYNEAVLNGKTTPFEIDDCSFETFI